MRDHKQMQQWSNKLISNIKYHLVYKRKIYSIWIKYKIYSSNLVSVLYCADCRHLSLIYHFFNRCSAVNLLHLDWYYTYKGKKGFEICLKISGNWRRFKCLIAYMILTNVTSRHTYRKIYEILRIILFEVYQETLLHPDPDPILIEKWRLGAVFSYCRL